MQNSGQINLLNVHCLLIDLDDTLYPQNSGVWDMIGQRMNQFLVEVKDFPLEEVPQLRQQLWHQYGTTLRGLEVEYSVERDFFLDYVHDVPLENALKFDPNLDQILSRLPQRKVIFTNAHAEHARRVLNLLGVTHHFEDIIDIYAMSPYCKPEVEAFQKTLTMVDEPPEHCLLIDDSPRNLETAQLLGMQTLSVGKHHHDHSPHIDTIHGLAKINID